MLNISHNQLNKTIDLSKYKSGQSLMDKEYYQYFGYGYFKGRELTELIPNVKINFYSFHVIFMFSWWASPVRDRWF